MVRKGKSLAFCLAAAVIFLVGGCAGKGPAETSQAEKAGLNMAETMAPAGTESTSWNEASESAETEGPEEEGPGAELQIADTAQSGDKDIEAFAELVQEAVSDKNLEALADLTAFPLKLETADGEKMAFEDRDEFLKQNPDLIFGDDLMVVIAGIDTATLELKEDRVTMGEEHPCITYEKKKNGVFRITDIRE